VQSSNSLPTFRDNISVPFSGVKKSLFLTSNMGPICCPETSVSNYRPTLRNIPEEGISRLHRDESLSSSTQRSSYYIKVTKSEESHGRDFYRA